MNASHFALRAAHFLSRLLPVRLQTREVLAGAERRELFARVPENDPGLRAVLDLLQEQMQSEFHVVINPKLPDEQRLRACDGLRMAWYALSAIEDERAAAKAWREEEQARKT